MAVEAGVKASQLEMLDIIRAAGITDPAVLQNLLPAYSRAIIPTPSAASQNDQSEPTRHRDTSAQNQPEPPPDTFAEALIATMTTTPSRPRTNSLLLPSGGPRTGQSARDDVGRSLREGDAGAYETRIATQWQPSEAAAELAQRFRDMAEGDYGRRCQICSRSFTQPNGEFQGFVVHLVQISENARANNLGGLVSLCGWHYALIRYGQWALLDRDGSPLNEPDLLRRSLEEAQQDMDDSGSSYVPIPIRFHNVYEDWNAQPRTIDAAIRYSVPHWTYLKELLSA